MDEWIKVRYIYKADYYLVIKREGNPAICNDMDESGGHFAE